MGMKLFFVGLLYDYWWVKLRVESIKGVVLIFMYVLFIIVICFLVLFSF